MESIGRFSLNQKIFFNLVFILLIVAGFFAMFALPAERFPDINMAVVNINTDYPGASPTDVETLRGQIMKQKLPKFKGLFLSAGLLKQKDIMWKYIKNFLHF